MQYYVVIMENTIYAHLCRVYMTKFNVTVNIYMTNFFSVLIQQNHERISPPFMERPNHLSALLLSELSEEHLPGECAD